MWNKQHFSFSEFIFKCSTVIYYILSIGKNTWQLKLFKLKFMLGRISMQYSYKSVIQDLCLLFSPLSKIKICPVCAMKLYICLVSYKGIQYTHEMQKDLWANGQIPIYHA